MSQTETMRRFLDAFDRHDVDATGASPGSVPTTLRVTSPTATSTQLRTTLAPLMRSSIADDIASPLPAADAPAHLHRNAR